MRACNERRVTAELTEPTEVSLTIRDAGEADIETLISMMGALDDQHTAARPDVFCGSSERPRSRDDVAGLLTAADSTVLVAALDGGIVGYVVIRMRDVDRMLLVHRRFGEVDALFVVEQARHRGVGAALMQAAEDWIRHSAGTAIELVVWEFNDAAIRFYEAQGYTTDFRRMRRSLEPPGG
jgi:ribosomal protein S18 acetylase RimI-like enzyme